jgi:diguanylate cyclase (GGDEF)-like protein
MMIVSTEEWVALAVETLFAPRGYAVIRVSTARQAFDRIRVLPPDLLIISRDLGDRSGVELCRMLEAKGLAGRTTPKLLLGTSPWGREERLEALQAGAWDVCHIPIDGEELFLRVDAWVQAKLAADVSREQGLLDSGTGLYNTAGVLKRMEEAAAGAGRHNRALACVIIAAEAADAAGNNTGSRTHGALMEALAERLRASGRASDAIGRVSDTQFVVVAPDTDEAGARGLINRLRGILEAGDSAELAATVRFGSFGVPHYRDASIAPTEMLIKAADTLRVKGDALQLGG